MKPGNWWRAQNNCVDNAKLIRLGDRAFRSWFNLMCLASEGGGVLPDIGTVAIKLRMTESRAAAALAELVNAKLFDRREDGRFEPHEWGQWQFLSDATGAERVQRYRDRRKALGMKPNTDYSIFYASLAARDGAVCVYCVETKKRLVVDHMTPIIAGGTDDIDNLCLACKTCNSGKAGRTPEQAFMTIRVTSAAEALARYRERVTVNSERQTSETDNLTTTVRVERGLFRRDYEGTPEFQKSLRRLS